MLAGVLTVVGWALAGYLFASRLRARTAARQARSRADAANRAMSSYRALAREIRYAERPTDIGVQDWQRLRRNATFAMQEADAATPLAKTKRS
jgi:hypothetical protein